MKVYLDHDYTSTYYLSSEGSYGDPIELTDAQWEAYQAYEREHEYWQSFLANTSELVKRGKLIEVSKQSGIQSKGF